MGIPQAIQLQESKIKYDQIHFFTTQIYGSLDRFRPVTVDDFSSDSFYSNSDSSSSTSPYTCDWPAWLFSLSLLWPLLNDSPHIFKWILQLFLLRIFTHLSLPHLHHLQPPLRPPSPPCPPPPPPPPYIHRREISTSFSTIPIPVPTKVSTSSENTLPLDLLHLYLSLPGFPPTTSPESLTPPISYIHRGGRGWEDHQSAPICAYYVTHWRRFLYICPRMYDVQILFCLSRDSCINNPPLSKRT